MLGFIGANNKSKNSNATQGMEYSILHAIARDYLSILLVDSDTGDFEVYSHNTDRSGVISRYFDIGSDYTKLINNYLDSAVYIEDRYAVECALSLENVVRDLRTSNEISITARVLSLQGDLHYIRHEIKATEVGNPAKFLLAVKDVDGEVKQNLIRQDQLRAAYLSAEKASRAKNEFIHNMSHDIRTPLNAIVGYTTIATENINDNDSTAKCIRNIENASQQLLQIIDEILDLGEVDNGRIKLNETTCTMKESIEQVINSTEQLVKDKQISIVVDNDDSDNRSVIFDNQHFNRVLINLISNAVKFSDTESRVELSVKADSGSEPDKTHYIIKVKDYGIGMSEEFMGRMFDPFERERTSTQSKQAGVGVGLTIVKNIIDAMDGSIHVESKLGQGTTFTIELELKLAPVQEVQKTGSEEEAKENSIAGKRILVVDDSKVNRDIAMAILKSFKAETDFAVDGDLAVEKFSESELGYYDLILMDIQMPKMEGDEATKLIRALDRADATSIPIVALTADVFEDTRQRCMEVGMNGFLTKPVNMKALYSELQTQFQTIN